MSDVGNDLYKTFKMHEISDDPSKRRCFSLQELAQMGIQLVSQLEILHHLGYTHSKLNL
jgi:hypothetical protein